jgi:hypothetical protein
LPVAGGDIVPVHVAGHVLAGFVLGDVPAWFSDHDDQLGFKIHLLGTGRDLNGGFGTDDV